MTIKALCIVSTLLFASASLPGQSISRFSSPLPLWADSALLKSGFWGRYDFTSRVSPQIEFGDLDGDGLWDVAIAVVDKSTRRRGLAIVHQIDRSVHVVGAGQPVGSRTQLPNNAAWGIGPLLGYRSGVRVEDWHLSGWFVWSGSDYVWVQDSY
jgi:hypothetical protein